MAKTTKKQNRYSLELCRQVWDDQLGDRIEVSEDADGLDLVELVQVDKDGTRSNHFTIPPEQALLVAEAVRQVAAELLAKEQGNGTGMVIGDHVGSKRELDALTLGGCAPKRMGSEEQQTCRVYCALSVISTMLRVDGPSEGRTFEKYVRDTELAVEELVKKARLSE